MPTPTSDRDRQAARASPGAGARRPPRLAAVEPTLSLRLHRLGRIPADQRATRRSSPPTSATSSRRRRRRPTSGSSPSPVAAFETWLPALLSGLGGKKVGFEAAHLPYATFEQIASRRPRSPRSRPPAPRPNDRRRRGAARDQGAGGDRRHPGGGRPRRRGVRPPHGARRAGLDGEAGGLGDREVHARARRRSRLLRDHRRRPGPGARCRTPTRATSRCGEGRPIVIDMGVRLDGYCSDLTRTIVLGEAGRRISADL